MAVLGCNGKLIAKLAFIAMLLVQHSSCSSPAGVPAWDQIFFAHWDSGGSLDDGMDGLEAPEETVVEPIGGVIALGDVTDVENIVILGAGPAGLSAAIYAARANLRPLLIAKDSGQLMTTSEVENYPSCQVSPSGSSIIESFWLQAKKFGARSLIGGVTHVNLSVEPFELQLEGGSSVFFKSMIVASGATSRQLKIPGAEMYYGKGVASCATCDGWHYRGQNVLVIGGGDTAMETALFLSRICKQVTIIHRGSKFRASKIMADRVLAHPKIAVEWNTTAIEFVGDGQKMTHVALSNSWGQQEYLFEVQAAFVVIGHLPNTAMFTEGALDMDAEGYIKTHSGTQTSVPAVFAAGDVADRIYRQAITSAGTGAMAAMDAERTLCHLGC